MSSRPHAGGVVVAVQHGAELELAAADSWRRGVCSVARLLVSTAVSGRPRAARRHIVGESSAAVRLQVQLSSSLTGNASISDLSFHDSLFDSELTFHHIY